MGREISRKVIFQIYNAFWWCAYYFKENVIHKTIMWQWKNHTNGSLEFMKNKSNILIYNITIYNVQKYKVGKHNHNDFINTRKSNQFYFMNFGIMKIVFCVFAIIYTTMYLCTFNHFYMIISLQFCILASIN